MAPRKPRAVAEAEAGVKTDAEIAEEARLANRTPEEVATDEGIAEAVGASVTGGKDSVTVTTSQFVREYSKAVHGADYKKLAQELADQYEDAVVA